MTTDMPAPDERSPGLTLYTLPDGSARLQLRIEHKTLWPTQRQLADLFQKSPPTINEHIQNIFIEGEMPPEATLRKFRIVQAEGSLTVERLVDHYSLDAVIAVGHRVRSARGGRADYFDELLERIRAIRASERRCYQKITDIYATSIDYDKDAAITQESAKHEAVLRIREMTEATCDFDKAVERIKRLEPPPPAAKRSAAKPSKKAAKKKRRRCRGDDNEG